MIKIIVKSALLWGMMVMNAAVRAEMFVVTTDGNPAVSMPPHFDSASLYPGMPLHPAMTAQVDNSNVFSVICRETGDIQPIRDSKQLRSACQKVRDLDAYRAGGLSLYPVVISPRVGKVLQLRDIEWAYSGKGEYRMTLEDITAKKMVHTGTVSQQDSVRPYRLTTIRLPEPVRSSLVSDHEYLISIENIESGQSTKEDALFSGRFRIKDTLTKVQRQKLEALREKNGDYFAAVYLSGLGYLHDSNQILNSADSSRRPAAAAYLGIINARDAGVPLDYQMRLWMNGLSVAMQEDDKSTAALICLQVKKSRSDLAGYWQKYIAKVASAEKLKAFCDLTASIQ